MKREIEARTVELEIELIAIRADKRAGKITWTEVYNQMVSARRAYIEDCAAIHCASSTHYGEC